MQGDGSAVGFDGSEEASGPPAPAPEVTEAQALLTLLHTLGPVQVVYRGDLDAWNKARMRYRREEARRWLRETALWIKTPTWAEQKALRDGLL